MKDRLANTDGCLLSANRTFVRSLRSPMVRDALIGCIVIGASLTIIAIGVAAQTTGGQSVESTAQSLFQTFYTRWRWPLCGLALIPAGWQWFSSAPRGKSRALSICAGILVWALIPYFISLFRAVTNS